MPYICIIDTSKYKPRRCSKKNWEPGTRNDFMRALNGWRHEEPDHQSLRWRLMMFQGSAPYDPDEYDSEAYQTWVHQPCNRLTYQDRLCEMTRSAEICPPGFKQGPGLRVGALIEAVDRDGYLEIPFSRVYDIRQYDRHMDGCVMRITKT